MNVAAKLSKRMKGPNRRREEWEKEVEGKKAATSCICIIYKCKNVMRHSFIYNANKNERLIVYLLLDSVWHLANH